jgi:hypothetical protein
MLRVRAAGDTKGKKKRKVVLLLVRVEVLGDSGMGNAAVGSIYGANEISFIKKYGDKTGERR